MVRKQELFGHIDKVRSLVDGGRTYKKVYGNLCHVIDGQWVSGQNVLTFLFFSRKNCTSISTPGAKHDQSV